MKLLNVSTPKHPNTFAQVDDADFDFINQWKWCAADNGGRLYVNRSGGMVLGKNTNIYLHRLLLKPPPGLVPDHIDGDTLNNQRSNLRIATYSQNQQNKTIKKGRKSSKYKGVSWHIQRKRWWAKIKLSHAVKSLGTFNLEDDAGRAYNKAAKEHFGEFARLNIIEGEES